MKNYEAEAKKFMKEHNAKMTISFKEEKINPWNEKGYNSNLLHNIYRVRIDRNNKTFSFDFADSAYNYQNRKRPSVYDVLACLQKYEIGSYHDFCNEFGYEIYDYDFMDYVIVNGERYNKKSWKTYKAVKKEYENVVRLFGDCMEQLCEIN